MKRSPYSNLNNAERKDFDKGETEEIQPLTQEVKNKFSGVNFREQNLFAEAQKREEQKQVVPVEDHQEKTVITNV